MFVLLFKCIYGINFVLIFSQVVTMLQMPLTRTSSCNDSTITDFSFKELLKRVGLQYKQSFAQVLLIDTRMRQNYRPYMRMIMSRVKSGFDDNAMTGMSFQ